MSSPADSCDLKQMKVNSISLGDDERNLEIWRNQISKPNYFEVIKKLE